MAILAPREEQAATSGPDPSPANSALPESPDKPCPAPIEFSDLDHNYQLWLGKFTAGVSPASLGLAYADWLAHLTISPGKLLGLWGDALSKLSQLQVFQTRADDSHAHPCTTPLPQDRRFESESWQKFTCLEKTA